MSFFLKCRYFTAKYTSLKIPLFFIYRSINSRSFKLFINLLNLSINLLLLLCTLNLNWFIGLNVSPSLDKWWSNFLTITFKWWLSWMYSICNYIVFNKKCMRNLYLYFLLAEHIVYRYFAQHIFGVFFRKNFRAE